MPGETQRNRAQKAPKKVSNSFAAFTPIPLLPHLHFVLAMANLRIPGPLLLLLMIKKFYYSFLNSNYILGPYDFLFQCKETPIEAL